MQELANELFTLLSEVQFIFYKTERKILKLPFRIYEPIAISQYISKVFKYIYGLKTIYKLKVAELEKRFDQELQVRLQQQETHYLIHESELKEQISKLQMLLEQSVVKNVTLPRYDKLSPLQKKLKLQNLPLKRRKVEQKQLEEIPLINDRLKRSRSSNAKYREKYDKSQQLKELIIINNPKETLNELNEIKDNDQELSLMNVDTNQLSTLQKKLNHQNVHLKKKKIEQQQYEDLPPLNNRLRRSRSSVVQYTENHNNLQGNEPIITKNPKTNLNGFNEINAPASDSKTKKNQLSLYPQKPKTEDKNLLNVKQIQTEDSQQIVDLSNQFFIVGWQAKSNLHFSELL